MKRLWMLLVFLLAPGMAAAATVTEVAAAQAPAFAAALQSAGLGSLLKGPGPFTLFAPSDEAFAKLGEKVKADPERLKAILAYHIVTDKLASGQLKEMSSARTMNGRALRISASDGNISVGNAKVLQADITASNGLVYRIDAVLMP